VGDDTIGALARPHGDAMTGPAIRYAMWIERPSAPSSTTARFADLWRHLERLQSDFKSDPTRE